MSQPIMWKKLNCAGRLNSKILRQEAVEHIPSFRDKVVTDISLLMVTIIVIHIAS
jgi:hypothetical protein